MSQLLDGMFAKHIQNLGCLKVINGEIKKTLLQFYDKNWIGKQFYYNSEQNVLGIYFFDFYSDGYLLKLVII